MMWGEPNGDRMREPWDEDVLDLIDAAAALERDLRVDRGAMIRALTYLLRRRQRFEDLKREYDVRLE